MSVSVAFGSRRDRAPPCRPPHHPQSVLAGAGAGPLARRRPAASHGGPKVVAAPAVVMARDGQRPS
eukprot:774026-Heterocapsa_arctica.AAC.1